MCLWKEERRPTSKVEIGRDQAGVRWVVWLFTGKWPGPDWGVLAPRLLATERPTYTSAWLQHGSNDSDNSGKQGPPDPLTAAARGVQCPVVECEAAINWKPDSVAWCPGVLHSVCNQSYHRRGRVRSLTHPRSPHHIVHSSTSSRQVVTRSSPTIALEHR